MAPTCSLALTRDRPTTTCAPWNVALHRKAFIALAALLLALLLIFVGFSRLGLQ